ncbi:rhomboid family intramembrane serine protease [Sulfurovum sp.]|uniref:rhomboid family intramembrane serine protease n=1 Tax=Sulfurovum sp. TaxID=1969726 RepID=UPI003C70CC15
MRTDIQRYTLTYILIAASSIVYLFSAFFSRSLVDMDMQTLVDMGALFGPLTVLKGEWWRLLSAMFLHGGMTHLLMNMFSLYIVGRGVEMYFDTKSYLSIYFFSGIIGGLVSLYMHPVSVGVGASGAIFGVFGALAGFFLAHRDRIASHSKAFMKDFGVIIAINLVIGLSIPSIDVSAHIGGLVIGFIGGFVLSKNPKWLLTYNTMMILLIIAIASYLPDQYAQTLF